MGRRLRIPPEKIDVIPRGRDGALLGRRSPERRRTVRHRLGVSEESPLVLAVGRQEPQKGFDLLLCALPAVRHELPEVQVLVAGRAGRASESLAELAMANDLSDTVHFLGMRDDVADLMAAADVLAFPSLWEGAAGTLQEAMALECPIVTSGLPTILETVDPSTAEVVAPGRSDELAYALINVLQDPVSAAGRALAARERFERDFTIEVSARRMADLYFRTAAAG
jgi:glycosyltransferase involved in cell wall biosynthesis